MFELSLVQVFRRQRRRMDGFNPLIRDRGLNGIQGLRGPIFDMMLARRPNTNQVHLRPIRNREPCADVPECLARARSMRPAAPPESSARSGVNIRKEILIGGSAVVIEANVQSRALGENVAVG